MRYDALKRDDYETTDGSEWWYVAQGKIPRFGRRMSAAEASIIAFALNAVAEGKTLSAEDVHLRYDYDGPTEGVAPNG